MKTLVQLQRQPIAGILVKKCFERIPKTYRTHMQECNFKKIAGWLFVTLFHIFRLPYHRNNFDLPMGDCFHNYKVNTSQLKYELTVKQPTHQQLN